MARERVLIYVDLMTNAIRFVYFIYLLLQFILRNVFVNLMCFAFCKSEASGLGVRALICFNARELRFERWKNCNFFVARSLSWKLFFFNFRGEVERAQICLINCLLWEIQKVFDFCKKSIAELGF